MKKKLGILFVMAMIISLMLPLAAQAGELDDFVNNLSLEARADSSGFRYRLRSQFNVGDATVDMVVGNVRDLAEAYMIFRLGEVAGVSVQSVLDVYRANRNKGWGVIAKELGIKPGSPEFHALKSGGPTGATSGGSSGGKGKGGKGKGRK